MLESILQNFITNSSKFRDRNGDIDIPPEAADGFYLIVIRYNVIKMTKEKLESILRLDLSFITN